MKTEQFQEDIAYIKMRRLITDAIDTTNFLGNQESLAEAIYEALNGNHRTLQQNFVRALYLALKRYGNDGWEDLRNQGAKEWARKATEINVYFPTV